MWLCWSCYSWRVCSHCIALTHYAANPLCEHSSLSTLCPLAPTCCHGRPQTFKMSPPSWATSTTRLWRHGQATSISSGRYERGVHQSLLSHTNSCGSSSQLLGRKVAADVLTNPQRHTLLPLKNPTVVPGGRFRETYYWDTYDCAPCHGMTLLPNSCLRLVYTHSACVCRYWIVRGLLVCDLKSTAVSVAQNLLDMAKANTFVPNGARAYYLHRSQPPVLSLIVHAVYNATYARGRW